LEEHLTSDGQVAVHSGIGVNEREEEDECPYQCKECTQYLSPAMVQQGFKEEFAIWKYSPDAGGRTGPPTEDGCTAECLMIKEWFTSKVCYTDPDVQHYMIVGRVDCTGCGDDAPAPAPSPEGGEEGQEGEEKETKKGKKERKKDKKDKKGKKDKKDKKERKRNKDEKRKKDKKERRKNKRNRN